MANVAQALVKLRTLESGLVALVAEGRRRTQDSTWNFGYGASEDERLYLQAAGFFNDLCRSLKQLTWLARFEEEAASLYQETSTVIAMADASPTVTWPLAYRTDWEVDFLGLEYQMRQHLPGLLDGLERLLDGLRKLLRQWADSQPSPAQPRPSAPVPAPAPAPRPMPPTQLRIRLLAGCR